MSQSPGPKPYNQEAYEEQLAAAAGQAFPESPFSAEEEPEVPKGFTGVVPRGAPMKWEEEALLNDRDKLDRETAWHFLDDPRKPLTARHREFCRLIAAGNMTYTEIGEKLGYTTSYMSVLSSKPKIRKHVDEIQQHVLAETIGSRMNALNNKALDVVEQTIADEGEKTAVRLDAARWLLEKTTGKAKQEIETKDGNLTDFMSLLRQFKEEQDSGQARLPAPNQDPSAAPRGDFIDVTPQKPEHDPLELWIDQNL